METISDPAEISGAWEEEYARLARIVSDYLPRPRRRVIELGCGAGRLTIPLAISSKGATLSAVDSFRGPYKEGCRELLQKLGRAGLKGRVTVIRADGLRWLDRQKAQYSDAVVSSELLPELTFAEMANLFANAFRVIRNGGITAHLFLSPTGRNPQQRLLIRADSDPRWTRRPPREWFSPPPRIVASALGAAGFTRVKTRLFRSRIRLEGEAAGYQLRTWGVRAAMLRRHRPQIEAGVELPDWVIARGQR